MVTIVEMRRALISLYPGKKWASKVNKMSDSQIFAIYTQQKLSGKVK